MIKKIMVEKIVLEKIVKKIIFAVLISMVMVVPVSAQEPYQVPYQEEEGVQEVPERQAQRIPYSVALRGALNNLATLTEIEDTLGDIEEMRDDLRALLELRRATGTLTRETESDLQRQIADLGATLNTMRANRDMIRIVTELEMRNSIIGVANTELDIKLLEATLEQERITFNNTQLRFNAGLISETDLRSAELALQQRESNLAALCVSLETERQTLNRILQRPVTGEFYVNFERELITLPTNLNAHVRRYAPRALSVRLQDITLNRARAALNDANLVIASPEHTRRERERNQAERSRNEELRRIETNMRNQYNNLTMLNHSRESLEIDLQRAMQRLEAAELNYQAGLTTRFDVQGAELAVLNAEVAIEKNLNNFWVAQFMFSNPL